MAVRFFHHDGVVPYEEKDKTIKTSLYDFCQWVFELSHPLTKAGNSDGRALVFCLPADTLLTYSTDLGSPAHENKQLFS